METSFNLKLNNNLTNVKNKFSSIFSWLFKRKNRQNHEVIEKDENMAYKNSEKSAINSKNNAEFVEKTSNKVKNEHNFERGVIPPFVIKIIISVVIVLVVSITLFVLFYKMVSSASLDFNVEKLAEYVKEFFVMIIYAVAKWILCVVDIIFSYVRSLCGLNMDFTSLSGIFSTQSDIVFNLLITAEKRASQIVRNLIALAIIMIILFTIIALVKSQLAAMRVGKPTSVMDTIKKTIKAFVFLLITPFMAIGGIVFSDLLLQTLFRATNTTNSSTLSTQIFATAAVSSNAYRNYALANGRIPITCDFTKEKEILEWYSHNAPSETFAEYLDSSNNLIYVTFMSFINKDFLKFTDINDIVIPTNKENREKAYYGIYDIKPGGTKYQRIETYAEEYFVMADVIDFGVNTGNSIYIKNIEAVLDSVCKIEDQTLREKTFNLMVQRYNLEFYVDEDLTQKVTSVGIRSASTQALIDCDSYQDKEWEFITYKSYYISPNDNGTPENPMQIPYVHVKGAHDEVDGARYIICYQNTVKSGDITYTYYEPMTNGYIDRYDISFNSEYIEDGQIIAAKGNFKDAVYPTAIKETAVEDTTQITFYREDLEAVAVGAMNEIFKANLNDDGDSNWFTNFVRMIQMFFQPDSIIGEITYNPDVIQASYNTKGIAIVNNLSEGRIKIGYFLKFKPSLPDRFAAGRTMSLKEMFDPQKFDLMLILVAPIILCRVGMISVFGLIQRAYELFLIILTYPAACATIPYEEKAYGAWWHEYINRLFATYGIILGINFVLALFPIIGNLEYFTPGEIATNKVLYKVTHLFFGFLTINQITRLLNTLVVILFELVAFTLLDPDKGVPSIINRMIGSEGIKGGFVESMKKLVSRIKNTVKAAVKFLKVVKTVVVGIQGGISTAIDAVKKPEDAKKRLAEFRKKKLKLLPGSKFLDTMQRNGAGRATKNAMKKLGGNMAAQKAALDAHSGEEPKKENFMPKDPGPDADPNTREQYEKDKQAAEEKFNEAHGKWEKEQQEKKDALIKPMEDLIKKQEVELQLLGQGGSGGGKDNKKKDSAGKKDDKGGKKGKSNKKQGDPNAEDGDEEKKDETSENKENSNSSDPESPKDSDEPKDSELENQLNGENPNEDKDDSEDKDDNEDKDDKEDKPEENNGSGGGNGQENSSNNSNQQNNNESNNQDGSNNQNNEQGSGDSSGGSGGGSENSNSDSGSSGEAGSEEQQNKKNGFNPDDYGNRGLEDEMKDTQKRHRDEARKQDALERQLAEQQKNGDTEGAKRTQKLIEQSKKRQEELDEHYFQIYAAQQDRIAEEQRIMKSGTAEEKQQLAIKQRMREANDEQRFADKEARGETTSARIKSFASGVALSVGNSIKDKVTSTASGIWNRHLERRNERWANAFTATGGNVFQKVGRSLYRKYAEQRMGGVLRKNEYENINKRLDELNKKYTHPENFDKNSQEYKDYIAEKTALEKRRDVLEADFNRLSMLKLQRTQNKTKAAQGLIKKMIGNTEDVADYADTSTLYRKIRALRHPLKTLRAKAATAIANAGGGYTADKRQELEKRILDLRKELGEIDGSPRNAQNQRRKQEILTELNHIAPVFEAFKQTDNFYKRWDNQTFTRKINHIKEDAIVYGEDNQDEE